MKLRNKRSGFTLIELLIVIVIIAILATLGLVAYGYALKNARNARRISDLNAIQAAFEQYYTANGAYVNGCGGAMDDSLQGLVLDPNTKAPYSGATTCSTVAYCICAALEPGSGNAGSAEVRGGNSDNASCTDYVTTTDGAGEYYCVQNRQ